jgi:hypothetical protein
MSVIDVQVQARRGRCASAKGRALIARVTNASQSHIPKSVITRIAQL